MPPPLFRLFSRWDAAAIWFLRRLVLTDPAFRALAQSAHARSWWMAQITQLDMTNWVMKETARAIASGVGFKDWKKRVGPKLRRAWGSMARDAAGRRINKAHRMQLIWRNAAQSSYGTARWKQMRSPAVMRALPWWLYDATMDGRTSPLCQALDGTIKEASDPFWHDHYPPNHHNCRSGVIPLTKRRAASMGGRKDPPSTYRQGRKTLPTTPSGGWGKSPDVSGIGDRPMPKDVDGSLADTFSAQPQPPPLAWGSIAKLWEQAQRRKARKVKRSRKTKEAA